MPCTQKTYEFRTGLRWSSGDKPFQGSVTVAATASDIYGSTIQFVGDQPGSPSCPALSVSRVNPEPSAFIMIENHIPIAIQHFH